MQYPISRRKVLENERLAFEKTAPDHRTARTLGLRFRHIHRVELHAQPRLWGASYIEKRHLAGTLVTEAIQDGTDRVRVAIVLVNPKDSVITKASGRAAVYAALRAGQCIEMTRSAVIAQLRDHSLFASVAKALGKVLKRADECY